MNTEKVKTEEKRYSIETGPSRDTLFDACKYAYSKTTKFTVDFGVALGYTGVCPAEIVIPDDVTCLASGLFDNDNDETTTNITSVVAGSGLKSIGSYAFYGADNLKTVTVSGALSELGNGAFAWCSSLTTACRASSPRTPALRRRSPRCAPPAISTWRPGRPSPSAERG